MFFNKKSNNPVVLLKEKVDSLITNLKYEDVPYILNSHEHSEDDIEEFEKYLKDNMLGQYLNDKDKKYCINHGVEFSTMRYINILKTISRGFGEFIKHKGQPTADDLIAKSYSITAWNVFHLFYKEIL